MSRLETQRFIHEFGGGLPFPLQGQVFSQALAAHARARDPNAGEVRLSGLATELDGNGQVHLSLIDSDAARQAIVDLVRARGGTTARVEHRPPGGNPDGLGIEPGDNVVMSLEDFRRIIPDLLQHPHAQEALRAARQTLHVHQAPNSGP